MGQWVRRKVAKTRNDKVVLPSHPETEEGLSLDHKGLVDWTRLPNDTVIHLFSTLNHRDRANLSSTCQTWRNVGMSPCLWQSLDLRAYKCDATTTSSLASRCENLQKIRFHGDETADAIIFLKARGLREISRDLCRKINDTTLTLIAARHQALEILQLGPFCDRISSDAIKAIAICCPNLRKLRLSGIRDVDGDAINALAKHCLSLIEIGFVDCRNIDEVAVGNVASLRYLSVAGTKRMNWGLVSQHWTKLSNLKGLDVSRTNITRSVVWILLSSSESLKVLCALHCPALEEGDRSSTNYYPRGKLIIAFFTDIFKKLASLLDEITTKESDVFSDWRNMKKKDKNVDEIMTWVEWILSYSLLRIADTSLQGFDNFWLSQGASLLLNLMQSSQEDVQERAATALATFVVIVNENARVDGGRAEAVMRGGGLRLLFNLARSWSEGLQSEATKAITTLSVNADVAKAVAEEGGITILSNLARSMYKSVAEEASEGLWNLSVAEEHKHVIAEAGGVKALVDLIFKWCTSGDRVLECAAGALANIAGDDKLSMKVAEVGGLRALVMLAQNSESVLVQTQAARALGNLASHANDNGTQAAVEVGREAGAIEALVQLTYSIHESVRTEAAGALWSLLFYDERNPEAIAVAGGVEALVSLAQSCSNASQDLKENVAGALWALAVLEANSGAEIGRFVAMLRNPSSEIKACAIFALLQFTTSGGRHVLHHVAHLRDVGAPWVLRTASVASTTPLEAKVYARTVLRNLE